MPLMDDEMKAVNDIAQQVLSFSRTALFMELRFMESALSRLRPRPYEGTIGTDTRCLYYDPAFILRTFQGVDADGVRIFETDREAENAITRSYLHTVLHCVFQHPYIGRDTRQDVWDLACDIAVEEMIRELDVRAIDVSMDYTQNQIIAALPGKVKYMTAEHIYQYFMEQGLSTEDVQSLQSLFLHDDHSMWYKPPGGGSGAGEGEGEGDLPQSSYRFMDAIGDGWEDDSVPLMDWQEARETWEQLSQQIHVDLETFSKQKGDRAGNMLQNLQELHRERYDYSAFLKKFAVTGEVMHIDEDSFDYNFYTYGLQLYGNIPLIEPLEYREEKRIREFVIAIDTSGSVQGKTVQAFIQKTYNILKQTENFHSKVNIHIIQCDADIQEDHKITCQEDFDAYIKEMKLHGFGGTDFRPAFEYVDTLIENKEFLDLRGLIYFTDGYGTFPAKMPHYKTAFVFLDDDYEIPEVPVWAIKLVLENKDIEAFEKD